MRILLVEDETKAADFIRRGLREEGYVVDVSPDGEGALEASRKHDYDLVVLDLMLPRMDGLDVCRTLRSRGLRVPILMLTARDSTDDKIDGLDSGADDYLTKPFQFAELLARIRALLRRSRGPGEQTLRAGDLILDPRRRSVSRGGRQIDLTTKEYALLEYMLRHPNQPLTRSRLLAHAWRQDEEVLTNIVDVYISRLRRKLEGESRKPLILTEHAVGYRLVVEEE